MQRLLAIAATLGLALSLFVLAPTAMVSAGTGTGSGPGTGTGTGEVECSPGYWKNHHDDWVGQGCGGSELSDGDLDAMLRARGPGSSTVREAARMIIQDCVGATCAED